MAQTDEEIRLILQVIGAENVEKLRSVLAQTDAEGKKLPGTFTQVDAATRSATTTMTTYAAAADKAHGSTVNLGYAGLTAGRVVQDFAQGGLGGILNNIDQVVTSLGGGGGLAGALTIVGVGLFVFKDKLKAVFEDYFPQAVDGAKGKVDQLKERIKELDAKPLRLAVETAELENARREVEAINNAVKAFEAWRQAQSTPEKESGAAVKKVLAEGDAAETSERVRSTFVREGLDQNLRLKEEREKQTKALADIEEFKRRQAEAGGDVRYERDIADAQHRLETAQEAARRITSDVTRVSDNPELAGSAQKAAGGLVDRATTGQGEEQKAAARELADRLARAGRPDLAGKVRGNSPDALREWNEGAAWQADYEEAEERAEALRQKLQVQGQTNKELADKAAQKQKDKDDKAEADMAKRVAGASVREIREVTPKASHNANVQEANRALLNNTAGQINQMTGGQFNPMQLAAAAEKSIELQHQHMNASAAHEAAIHAVINNQLILHEKINQLSVNGHHLGQRANETTARLRTNLPRS